jgi:hypothetical protein
MINKKLIIILIILTLAVAWICWQMRAEPEQSRACTEEARLCPDGSAVGRVAPSCEFAACPVETSEDDKSNDQASHDLEVKLAWPLADAQARVTKKPFGIRVSPSDSPVQPERFVGYHSGVDFEIKAGEEDQSLPVTAICAGEVKLVKWVSGYGGLLITSCEINKEAVTVLYGHLSLASITKKLGESVQVGEQVATLGQGFSRETDGERKHLHLGIHRGTATVLAGYVATEQQLAQWLDPVKLIDKD